MILECERLYLQPFKDADTFRIAELANNKELADILGLPHPYNLEIAQEWVSSQPELISKGLEYPLAIHQKELNEIIGTITLRIDKNNNKGELGYWIGRNYWGNGYASEAVNRVIAFGLNEINLNKICASALSRNKPSIKVLEKNGLKEEGLLKQNRLLLGNYEDVNVFGLLINEYQK